MKVEAIRGIMGNMEYYLADIPFKEIPKLFKPYFTYERLKDNPFEKYQREISESRVAKIEKYLLETENFVLPATTISVEGDIKFTESPDNYKLGTLEISNDALWIINDGQHRIKAIFNLMNLLNSYNRNPKDLPSGYRRFVKDHYERLKYLAYESLPMQIFVNLGTERNQQIFSDINRTAKKTPKSLDILFDNRDERAKFVKDLLQKNKALLEIVELEKGSIPKGSNKVYTLVDIYNVAKILEDKSLTEEFFEELTVNFEFNQDAKEKYIYSYSVFLMALAKAVKEAGLGVINEAKEKDLSKERLKDICVFDGKIRKTTKTIDNLKKYILQKELIFV
ncbi:DNA sulfur modification protein DndB [Persephonella sp.]